MADPISVPIPTDPGELADIAFEVLEGDVAGYDRSARGDPTNILVRANAQVAAEGNETASDVPFEALLWQAEWVDGLLPIVATSAQTTATITALDDLGYTVRDGDRFEYMVTGEGGPVFFAVGDTVIAPLSTSTGVGEVVLVAETPGAAGSGLATDIVVRPVDALAWIDTVTPKEITTAGVDAEASEDHLARWIKLRRLSNDTPLVGQDAAVLVKELIPGVGRTIGIDNYNPADGTDDNESMSFVAATDPDGEPLGSGLKAAAVALLESKRLAGFQFPVGDATYSTIDAAVEYLTRAGFDVTASDEVVAGALTTYLTPIVWSTSAGSNGDDEWRALAKVYHYEAITLVNNIETVDRVTSLKLGLVRPVTGVASTDLFTLVAHDYTAGTPVIFRGMTGGAGITAETEYFVIASGLTADAFRVSATLGGSTINFTTDLTVGTVRSMQAADVTLAQPAALTRPGVISAVGTAP